MKRIALLAVTAALAVLISACGQNTAEKKAENGAATTTEQQTQGQTDTTDTNKNTETNKTNQ